MNCQPLPDRWTDDPGWLAQAIDPPNRLIRLVRMDEGAYRTASFLDDRLLQANFESRICALDEAMNIAATLPRDDARWIFHIGHVGSTLIARLLGELDGVLSIREPRSLRDLTVAVGEERAELALQPEAPACPAPSAPAQSALVKATSFVSEMAPLLMPPGSSALFLYATPANYIASILAGENSLKELAALHSVRVERLQQPGDRACRFRRQRRASRGPSVGVRNDLARGRRAKPWPTGTSCGPISTGCWTTWLAG